MAGAKIPVNEHHEMKMLLKDFIDGHIKQRDNVPIQFGDIVRIHDDHYRLDLVDVGGIRVLGLTMVEKVNHKPQETFVDSDSVKPMTLSDARICLGQHVEVGKVYKGYGNTPTLKRTTIKVVDDSEPIEESPEADEVVEQPA